ncbi:MAG: bifunctional riboflavin kinase/FAD synthetase [Bacteroidetes bacterium]|nr:bifunctional riboflavin kinase/FAD synthetase [Bacteroidota bacterium]
MISRVERTTNRVLTVGTFDGVHRGHVSIIQAMMSAAEPSDRLTAVTFDPHPREVLGHEAISRLMTLEERAHFLLEAGINDVVVIPFDRDLAAIPARAFVREVLQRSIGFRTIVVGYDHRFGRNGEGDVALLRMLGDEDSFSVLSVPATLVDGETVSSSAIRRYLEQDGDVHRAATLLGRPYTRAGVVVRGDGRGRKLGFPTANMQSVDDTVVPASGVYAVRASGENLDRAPAVMNIGVRPTFGGKRVTEEVHVLDWDGDLYDSRLTVEFVRYLRAEQKFDSIEALVNQLGHDLKHCRRVLNSVP